MTGCGVFAALFVLNIAISSVGAFSEPEEASRKNIQKLALANNELAFNLLRKLTSESSENVFFSPFSISTAFGLLFYGTRGGTSEELRKTLGYEKADLSNELVFESLSLYLKEVTKNGNSSNGYVLNAANAVLVDKKIDVLEEYRRNVKELFQAIVQDVDFETESPNIVREINAWVKEKTNGKIEKILDQLDPATVFVLLNAVYFKGTWKTQFDPKRTRDDGFYNDGIKERSVEMMHIKSDFPYTSGDDFQALELPYKGGNISMLILLPNRQNGLEDLEECLSPKKLAEIQRRLYIRKVDVSLPKFNLQLQKELSEDMQALGANRIFRADSTDFSGMTYSKNVEVNQIVHKAVIEVNEEGSEAAAVTGIIMAISASVQPNNPIFKVDHPFLFAIVEKESNMILFLGSVKNLQGKYSVK